MSVAKLVLAASVTLFTSLACRDVQGRPGSEINALVVDGPIELKGLFDFQRIFHEDDDGKVVGRTEAEGESVTLARGPTHSVELDKLTECLASAARPSPDAHPRASSRATLRFIVQADASAEIDIPVPADGMTTDLAFKRFDGGTQHETRVVWVVSRAADDLDDLAFVTGGLPPAPEGTLLMTFDEPLRLDVYSRLTLQTVGDQEAILVSRTADGGYVITPADST